MYNLICHSHGDGNNCQSLMFFSMNFVLSWVYHVGKLEIDSRQTLCTLGTGPVYFKDHFNYCFGKEGGGSKLTSVLFILSYFLQYYLMKVSVIIIPV